LQLILGLDAGSSPALVMVDLLTLETRRVSARRDPDCSHVLGAAADAPDAAPIELEFGTLAAAVEAGLELVDIREAWECDLDPPSASTLLHLPLSDLVNGRAQFPAQGRYLVICAHGVRSLSLTEHLRSLGQPEVYSLRGGLAALRCRGAQ
jgi:rhodanese-related sulfurtransferase